MPASLVNYVYVSETLKCEIRTVNNNTGNGCLVNWLIDFTANEQFATEVKRYMEWRPVGFTINRQILGFEWVDPGKTEGIQT